MSQPQLIEGLKKGLGRQWSAEWRKNFQKESFMPLRYRIIPKIRLYCNHPYPPHKALIKVWPIEIEILHVFSWSWQWWYEGREYLNYDSTHALRDRLAVCHSSYLPARSAPMLSSPFPWCWWLMRKSFGAENVSWEVRRVLLASPSLQQLSCGF